MPTALMSRHITIDVGASYLSATSSPRDPVVVDAYAHLQAETDQLFDALARRHDRQAIRVAFTRCPQPYANDRELIESARADHVLEVATAAVHPEPLHPLLGCEYAGPFDRFRAVHDLVGHVSTGLGFGLDDELAVWRVQHRLHGRSARRALATELLAINSARAIIGEAPVHKATLLDVGLVQRTLAQLSGCGQWPSQGFDGRDRPLALGIVASDDISTAS
jgi:hypothetical protein